jgi:hypothetical protein
MKEQKKVLRHPDGLRIELDREQVIPDNPGDGTPALVFKEGFKGNATLGLVEDLGVLHAFNDDGVYMLTDGELKWLHDQTEVVNSFLGWNK